VRGQVRANEIALHVLREGTGSDLVLTHGLGSSLEYWLPCVPALARHHRVLCWDVRGFGASEKPPGPYSPELFAEDLASLVRELGIRKAHFCGISMGGVITQRLALDFPDLVRSMVLVSTSSEVSEAAGRGWQKLADEVERAGFRDSAEVAKRSFSPAFAAEHPDIVEAVSRTTRANDPRAYAAAARAMSRYNWTERLRAIEVPTLILQGTDDLLTPPGGSVIMSRQLPRSRLLMIRGAGHNLPIEQPLVFENCLLAFTGALDLSR